MESFETNHRYPLELRNKSGSGAVGSDSENQKFHGGRVSGGTSTTMATWSEQDSYSDNHDAFGASDEIPKLDNQSTPKIPPAFDGRGSWFVHEEAIDYWLDIAML